MTVLSDRISMRLIFSVMSCLVDLMMRCAGWPNPLFKDFDFIALRICSGHIIVRRSFRKSLN